MEVDHDLDLRPDRVAQRLHQPPDLVDIGQRRVVVGIGNEHRLQRPIAPVDHLSGTLNQRLGLERLVDGAHIAQSEVSVDLDPVAHLAAEQPPDRLTEPFAEDVPQRQLDARHRRHADHAEAPEGVLLQHPHRLLDVARIAADQKRSEVLDGTDDGLGLPFERRLAPAVEAVLVGLDAHEHPIAHVGVDDAGADVDDFHLPPPPRSATQIV
jgi:hypothetical protein